MGRRLKNPITLEYLNELENKHPEDAYMRKKSYIIGVNIRKHRKQRVFSIDDLAKFLDISESYIGLLERGERCPSLKIVYKLCELFEVTPDDLLQPDPDMKEFLSGSTLSIAEEKAAYNSKMKIDAVFSLAKQLNDAQLDFLISTIKNVEKMG